MHVRHALEAERGKRALDRLALRVEDPSQLDQMCEQLLTNPLIEDYEIQS